jgi:hypothetical protein
MEVFNMEFKCNIKAKHPALKQLFKGTAMGCGSQCFQTSDGAQFLGKLPDAAKTELASLVDAAAKQGNYEHHELLQKLFYYSHGLFQGEVK